jgi:hypothetical protein
MTDLFGPGLKAQLLETINMPEVSLVQPVDMVWHTVHAKLCSTL